MENINETCLNDWNDNKEWSAFFQHYYSFLKSLAISYNLPSQDVDDVVQEVFITMAKHFRDKKFDSNKGAFHSWVTQFAKWRMIDIIRRNQTRAKVVTSGDDLLMESQPDETADPTNKYELEHQREIVTQALQNLSAGRSNKELKIFNDIFFNDLSQEELMEKHDTNASGIYLAKHRVMKKLKAEIAILEKQYV